MVHSMAVLAKRRRKVSLRSVIGSRGRWRARGIVSRAERELAARGETGSVAVHEMKIRSTALALAALCSSAPGAPKPLADSGSLGRFSDIPIDIAAERLD